MRFAVKASGMSEIPFALTGIESDARYHLVRAVVRRFFGGFLAWSVKNDNFAIKGDWRTISLANWGAPLHGRATGRPTTRDTAFIRYAVERCAEKIGPAAFLEIVRQQTKFWC